MFATILTLTAIYFLAAVIWDSKGPNKFFKCVFSVFALYGALLISAHQGITVNDTDLSHLYTRLTVGGYFALSAVYLLWFAWMWTRKNWLNVGVKLGLYVLSFCTFFQLAVVVKLISVA